MITKDEAYLTLLKFEQQDYKTGGVSIPRGNYAAIANEIVKLCSMPYVVRCASCKNDSNFSESGKQEICIEGEYRYVTATICNSCGTAIEIEFFD